MPRVAFAIVVALTAASLQAYQTPQSSAVRRGRASIGGRVTDLTGREGLSHAQLTLRMDRQMIATTIADADGRYRFDALPPGTYDVDAAKPAYLASSVGQVMPGRGGSHISVELNTRVDDADIRMWRGAVVTGTLRKNGNPVKNYGVSLLRAKYTPTGRSFEKVSVLAASYNSGPSTDDRGEFRLFGIAPGQYLVLAATTPAVSSISLHVVTDEEWRQAQTPSVSNPTVGLPIGRPGATTSAAAPLLDDLPRSLATYFPATPLASEATPIDLRAEEIRSGVDIDIVTGRMLSISGTLERPAGSAATPVIVQVLSRDPQAGRQSWSSTVPNTTSSFAMHNLPPGDYIVEATGVELTPAGPAPGPKLWGATEVSLSGTDATGISVRLQPPATVSGTVSISGQPAADEIPIDLMPDGVPAGSIKHALHAIAKDGRFSFSEVLPGRYRIAIGAHTAPLFAATTIGNDDVSDTVFEIPAEGLSQAVAVKLADGAALSGHLHVPDTQRAGDFSVLVIPSNRALWFWQSRSVRAIPVHADGAFSTAHLPPGSYSIAAVHDLAEGEEYDPELLESALTVGVAVQLTPDSHVLQELRVSGRGGTSRVPVTTHQ